MPNYAEYFERTGYQPKYHIGDRVTGTWNGIPFCGTVGNDTMINAEEGPRISVFLDLPIRYEHKVWSVIMVKHRQVRLLKQLDLDASTNATKNVRTKK